MGFWGTLGKIASFAAPIALAPLTGGSSLLGLTGNAAKIANAGLQVAGGLGALSKGRAEGRVAESAINQNQDRIATDIYRAQMDAAGNENTFNQNLYRAGLDENTSRNVFNQNTATGKNQYAVSRMNADLNKADLDLAQRKFQVAAPGARGRNAVQGDILSSAQDVSFSGLPRGITVPTVSGGLRPSMFSANTRALGSNMSAQALREQERGDVFTPLSALPEYESAVYQGYGGPVPTYQRGPAAPAQTPLPQAGKIDKILNIAGAIGSTAERYLADGESSRPSAGVDEATPLELWMAAQKAAAQEAPPWV